MFTEKLEGTTVLSDSKVTQKSMDSLLLIGARVQASVIIIQDIYVFGNDNL